MKYLTIVIFALVLNLSVLNASFYINEVKTLTTLSIEMDSEKIDISEVNDMHGDIDLYFKNSAYIPLSGCASCLHIDFSFFYAYEKIFILFKPPSFNLFV